MAIFKRTLLNIDKYLVLVFFWGFIFSLFFPVRHVFYTNSAFQTGAYSDFTSISLYLSDILLIFTFLSLITIFPKDFFLFVKNKIIVLFIIWLILDFIWHYNTLNSLNIYFSLKYAELIVAYGTMATLFKNYRIKKAFFCFFSGFAVIQSLLALLQFIFQKSIGLKYFGEQVLGPNLIGVAKIVVNGTKYIRGYGTFPHPNLLSAFLVFGILVTAYLFLHSKKVWQNLLLGIMLFVNIFGLIITFSRAGYLATTIGLLILFGFVVFSKKFHGKQIASVIIVITGAAIIAFAVFHSFILTRVTITDQATFERETYNAIGLKIVASYPFSGTGIGESVLHMEQYAGTMLQPWQKQPIHNYFLLAAAELGIPGALILIWLFLSQLWKLAASIKHQASNLHSQATYNLLIVAILTCFFVLMQFDHYFYTLQQTQMLLWLTLGIAATATVKNPPTLEETGD